MTTFPNVAVVGMHFRGAHAVEIAAALVPGNTLILEPEPDNAYDGNALKAIYMADDEPIHIGYIERGQAAWITPLLADGASATCTVTRLETRRNNVHPIVEIVVG